MINTKTPRKSVGTSAANYRDNGSLNCRHRYITRVGWNPGPVSRWRCGPELRRFKRGSVWWKETECNLVVGGQERYSFGFWYRAFSVWSWYPGENRGVPSGLEDQNRWTPYPYPAQSWTPYPYSADATLNCHVGTDAPSSPTQLSGGTRTPNNKTNLWRAYDDVGSAPNTPVPSGPPTSSTEGSGGTFASAAAVSAKVNDSDSNLGRSTSSVYMKGSNSAWSEYNGAAPVVFGKDLRNPAREYVADPDLWKCSYDKWGYVVNGVRDAGTWVPSSPAGQGWGKNNTGPRIDTGPDFNNNNTSAYNAGKPANQQQTPNIGIGYMVQLGFSNLVPSDLANPANTGGGARGNNNYVWTAGAPSAACPYNTYTDDSFYKQKIFRGGGSSEDDTQRNLSVFSRANTCWNLSAEYGGQTGAQWKYNVMADDMKEDSDTQSDQELQQFVKVYSSRSTR